jgi:predicted CoA-binding protein
MNVQDVEIKGLLQNHKKITVIGMSSDSSKPSHKIPFFLKSKRYDVVAVHPEFDEIAGIKVFRKLQDVPADYRRFLDIFRRAEAIPQLIDEILALGGTEVIWLQLGITHPSAEEKAETQGLKVISDRCIHIEHVKFFG